MNQDFLDLLRAFAAENAARVMQALRAFGAPTAAIAESDFSRPGVTY